MKRILLILVAAVVIFFAGRAVGRALVSDETKIQRLVAEMVEGFNETRMDPVRDGLDLNFLDETYGADRELVRMALAHLFFGSNDPVTKKFLYQAEHTVGPVTITKDADGTPHATTDVEIAFSKRKGDVLEPTWKIRVHATLEKRDGGWRFFRTQTSTLSGDQLR